MAGGLTYADLAAFPDDGLRRELIHGELIVTPSPLVRHQRLVGFLHLRLAGFVEQHGGGEVFLAPMDVLFSNDSVIEPDLFFIPSDSSEIITRANIQGVPALVIEVMSDARIDRIRKRDLYAEFGVPEYWIVDPEADRVEVYTMRDGGYGKPAIVEPGETLTCDAIGGFTLDVTTLFAR
ncbi:MAG TPA: Uma2 family endonuclease [Actinomycetota bacterium]